MGRLAIERPVSRALVADWKKQPSMLGMRFTFHTDLQRPWLTDGTADWLWRRPSARRFRSWCWCRGPWLNRAARDRSPFEDLPKVCALAKLPNVAVKASGMPSLSAERYPFRDLHAPIRRLVDAFGPRRTFWGTDLTRMPCTYRECVTLFTRNCPGSRAPISSG